MSVSHSHYSHHISQQNFKEKKKKKTQIPMRGFQLNRDKKSIRGHTTTIRRECLSKLLLHATGSARGSQGGT